MSYDREYLEALAAHAHSMWTGWMEYMFSCGCIDERGQLIIPADKVARWSRQMNTDYAELPEHEKPSDRKEAREMLEIIDNINDSRETRTITRWIPEGWYTIRDGFFRLNGHRFSEQMEPADKP